ncbi:MAG TPA: hypothetical protein IAA03_05955 [Candidatus Ruminococcus avistercoris]|nr:hypothetical protein [Candidatus Ruminococcus avistercoris]
MKTYRMKAISLLAAWILAMSGCLTPVLADGSEEEENREQYFIIYDANGGEGSIEKTAVKAGEEAARSEDNAKTGEKDGKESDPVDAQAPVIEWFCGGGAFFVGDKALLEIHASVGDGGTVSYQWYQSTDGSTAEGTAVAGAQDTLFEAPTQEAGLLYYYCVVTNTNEQADGKKTAQTVSQAVSVMVTEPRKITVDAEKPVIEWISGGGTFNQGDPAVLEVKATVTDGGTLSYQWYRSEDGTTEKGTALDGATENTYYPSTDVAGTVYYYCEVTNTNEQVNGEKTAQAVSEAVSVTVEDPEPEPEIVNAQTPVIEWIRGGGTFQTGDKAALEVKAGVSDGGSLSYQWYQSSDGSAAGGTAIDGAVSAAYQPSTETAGTFYYYCEVTNTNDSVNGEKTAQAVSDAVKVTVNENVSAVTDAEKPKVSGPSGSGTYYESDNFKLQVKASAGDGGTLTYQWYNNKEKIEGATQAEYKPSVGTGYYYCVVVNINPNASGEKTAYTASDAVKVTVKEGNRPRAADTPEVSGPSGGGTYYKGQSPRLEVKASVDDGGTLTYQWYKNSKNSNENGTLIQGATSSIYQPSTKTVGTAYYYCVVSNTNEEASETRTVRYVTGTAKVSVIEKGSVKNNVKRASPVSRNNRTTATKTRASNARTEDENNVMLLLLLMLGAGGTAAGLILRRRFRRQD